MRDAHDAPRHLSPREPERIRQHLPHVRHLVRLERLGRVALGPGARVVQRRRGEPRGAIRHAARAPQLAEPALERGPGFLDARQEPFPLRRPVPFVAVLREVREEQVGEEGADVEPEGAVKGKLVIDDERGGFGAHDGAGVQVAVEQRRAVAREPLLERADRGLELGIGPERSRGVVQLGRRPVVVVSLGVRLGEDDLLGERAHVLVLAKGVPRLAQLLAPDRERGGSEQGGGQVLADVSRERGVHGARDDAAAEDDVRGLEVPHDDDGHGGVVEVHLGDVLRAVPVRDHERLGLVPHALLRERPGLADHADKGKALLDDDRAPRSVADDVDKVDVAVANLLGGPGAAALRAAQRARRLGLRGAVVQHGVAVERDEPGRARRELGRRRLRSGSRRDKLTDHELPARGLRHHALLGDDPGDERRGGDVEGRVPDVDAVRRDALPEHVRDLRRGPVFDDDVGTLARGRVQGAERRRDEERHVVVLGGDGEVVGADLVGGVAVVGDSIGAHDDGVDFPFGHERRRRGVADEGAGHLLEGDLVRGEPGALVVGPCFVAVDVFQAVCLAKSADDAERGSEARGCEGSGVAVGEDPDGDVRGLAHGCAERVGAEGADRAVVCDVRREHALALGDDRLDGVLA